LRGEELVLLRGIVRKTHLASVVAKHGVHFVTDKECDKMIESIGPEVVERMIRFGVDKGLR
jgi:translation initiation factor 2 beta subunit (eIF-2beta)/eIF-5